jgi:hypothetical protein
MIDLAGKFLGRGAPAAMSLASLAGPEGESSSPSGDGLRVTAPSGVEIYVCFSGMAKSGDFVARRTACE